MAWQDKIKKKAEIYMKSNLTTPQELFEKYYLLTEITMDGFNHRLFKIEQGLKQQEEYQKNFLKDLKSRMDGLYDILPKIRQIHENIFTEYQQLTEEVKALRMELTLMKEHE